MQQGQSVQPASLAISIRTSTRGGSSMREDQSTEGQGQEQSARRWLGNGGDGSSIPPREQDAVEFVNTDVASGTFVDPLRRQAAAGLIPVKQYEV